VKVTNSSLSTAKKKKDGGTGHTNGYRQTLEAGKKQGNISSLAVYSRKELHIPLLTSGF
jgi:hypothetical protein